jgi:hypothetical protein
VNKGKNRAEAQISGSNPRLAHKRLSFAQVLRRLRRPPRRLLRRRLRPLREAVLTDELAGDISLKLAICFTSSVLLRNLSFPTIPIVPGAP